MKRFLQVLVLVFAGLSGGGALMADVNFALGPDSFRQEGVPVGSVEKFTFSESAVFPGTTRDYWIYVPAQYDASSPACLMVFQDGGGYVSREGQWRVPNVFDNLIHRKEMPVTIGLFINPGVVPAPSEDAQPRFNRSFEYDALGDRYASFLIDEMLPLVSARYNISDRPDDRAIAGSSSGGVCAFTVAWERPDQFRRVFTTVGTYVGLRGADVYPTLIRKTEPKPIRIFLQDGSKDLNIYGGNWWIANLGMLSALQFSGYDVMHAWGEGGHNGRHGASVLPDALRWLWKGYPGPVQSPPIGAGHKLADILIHGEEWELLSDGHHFTEGPVALTDGSVLFSDIPNSTIYKINPAGKVTLFASNTGRANGLTLADDGLVYACAAGNKSIAAYNPVSGIIEHTIEGFAGNDLIAIPGMGYFTSPSEKAVYHVDDQLQVTRVDTGISRPNGIAVSPDHTLLYVADSVGRYVYSFQIQPNGSLRHKQEFFHLHLVDDIPESGADGMTVDTEGRLYVATHAGIQMCDQPGRVNAIIPSPARERISNLTFAGRDMNYLYITAGEKVYRRKTSARGFHPWMAPNKPPRPRL